MYIAYVCIYVYIAFMYIHMDEGNERGETLVSVSSDGRVTQVHIYMYIYVYIYIYIYIYVYIYA
jgi:hypothetical protein